MALNSELQQMLSIASELTHGEPSRADLACPYCGSWPLAYSYTYRDLANEYGFYIGCRVCGHWHHYSLGERPPNFCDDLVIPEFQRLEEEAKNGLVES